MSYDEIEEIELEEFGFQARRPIQLFTNNQEAAREAIQNQFVNYLCVSYTHKVIMAYLNNELKLVKIDEISKNLEKLEESDDSKPIILGDAASYNIEKNIIQLVLNADETHLLLAFDDNSIGSVPLDLLINNKFNDDLIDLIYSFDSKIISFLPSKKFSNLSLVLLESNDLYLIDLQNKSSKVILSDISAANWYDSSIIVGNSNVSNKIDIYLIGDFHQPFKSIPISSFDETPNIYSINFIDDNTLLAVLGDSLNSAETGNYQSLIIDLKNPSNIKYTDRIYSPFGVIPRMSSFYAVTLSHWSESFSDILFSIGSKSIDFDTLTPNLIISQLNDSDRASMPMDDETDDDDTPLGFILDLQASERVLEPCKTLDSCDPLPRFIVLTNRGQLLSWNIWYTKDILSNKVSLLNALNLKLKTIASSTIKSLAPSLKADSQASSLFSNKTTVSAATSAPAKAPNSPGTVLTFGNSDHLESNSNPFGSTSASAFGNFGSKPSSTTPVSSKSSTSDAFKNISVIRPETLQVEDKKETTLNDKPFGNFSLGNALPGNNNTDPGRNSFGQSGFGFLNTTEVNKASFGKSGSGLSNSSANTSEATKTAFGHSGFGFSNTSTNTNETDKSAFGRSGFGFSINSTDNAETNKSAFGQSGFGSSKNHAETNKSAFSSFSNTSSGFAAFSGNLTTSASPFSNLTKSSEKKDSIFGDAIKTVQSASSKPNSFNNYKTNGFSFGESKNSENDLQINSDAFGNIESSFGQQNSGTFGDVLGNGNDKGFKSSGFGAFGNNLKSTSPFANLVKDNKPNDFQKELSGNSNGNHLLSFSTEDKKFSFGDFGNSLNEINDESKIKEFKSDDEDENEESDEEDEEGDEEDEEDDEEDEEDDEIDKIEEPESGSLPEFGNKDSTESHLSFDKNAEHLQLQSEEKKPFLNTKQTSDISGLKSSSISPFGNFDVSELNKRNNFDGIGQISVDELSLNSKHDKSILNPNPKSMIFNNLDGHKENEKLRVKDIIANFSVDSEKPEKIVEKVVVNIDNTEIAKKMALWEERRLAEAKIKKEEEHKEKERLAESGSQDKKQSDTQEKPDDFSEGEIEKKQAKEEAKEPNENETGDKVLSDNDNDNESKESFELIEKEMNLNYVAESSHLPAGGNSKEASTNNEIEKELAEETKELSQLDIADDTAEDTETNTNNKIGLHFNNENSEQESSESEDVTERVTGNKEVGADAMIEGKIGSKEQKQAVEVSRGSAMLSNSLYSSKYALGSDKDETKEDKKEREKEEGGAEEQEEEGQEGQEQEEQVEEGEEGEEGEEQGEEGEEQGEEEEKEIKKPSAVVTNLPTLAQKDKNAVSVSPPYTTSNISTAISPTTLISADPRYINASMEIEISKEIKLQNFEDNEVYFSKLYIPKNTPILISRGNTEYPKVTSNLPSMSQEMMKIIYDVSVEFDVLYKNITLLKDYLSDQMDDEIIIHTLEKSLAFPSFWRFCEVEKIARGIGSEFQEFEALTSYFTNLENSVDALHQDILKGTKDMVSIEKEIVKTNDNFGKSQVEILNSDTPLSFENVYKRRSLRDKISSVQKTQKKLQSTVLFLNSQLNPTKLIDKPQNLEIILSVIDSKIRNHLDTVRELKESIGVSPFYGKKKASVDLEQSSGPVQQYSLVLTKNDAKSRMASMITKINSKKSVAEILSDRQFNLSYYTL